MRDNYGTGKVIFFLDCAAFFDEVGGGSVGISPRARRFCVLARRRDQAKERFLAGARQVRQTGRCLFQRRLRRNFFLPARRRNSVLPE